MVNSIKTRNLVFSSSIFILLLFLYICMTMRSIGMPPQVFADEWSYSSMSRLLDIASVPVPSYLYFSLFSITNICGDAFLECARTVNNIIYFLSIPAIYLISRLLFLDKKISVFLAVALGLLPTNIYTAFFMPETLYSFVFLLYAILVFSWLKYKRTTLLILSSIALAALSMIKVHALFLLLSQLVFLALIYFCRRDLYVKWSASLFFATFILFRISCEYYFKGNFSLNLFGDLYGGVAKSGLSDLDLFRLLKNFIINLSGQTLGLLSLFLPALLLTAKSGLSFILNRDEDKTSQFLGLTSCFLMVTLTALLGIVALFSAKVVGSSEYESIARLHFRYYNFLFPVMLVLIAAIVNKSISKPITIAFKTTLLLVTILCAYITKKFFAPTFIDSPTLYYFLIVNFKLYLALSVSVFIASLIKSSNTKIKGAIFCLSVALISININIWQDLKSRSNSTVWEKAADFTKLYLSKNDINKLLIVSDSHIGNLRTNFNLDSTSIRTLYLEPGSNVALDEAEFEKYSWVLVFDSVGISENDLYSLKGDGFRLFKIDQANNIVVPFNRGVWPGVVTNVKGLKMHEFWGTWSNQSKIEIDLVKALPQKFELRMNSVSFRKSDEPFVITMCGRNYNFSQETTPTVTNLRVVNECGSHKIVINIPESILTNNVSQLGLGIVAVEIESIE